jgi:tRNA (guanine26-N2/guanine27-N2)-dimethyltransferase
VDLDFPTRIVREGLVDILVPDVERRPGPGTRSALPFYNPGMIPARDLTALLAGRLIPKGGRALDGLAAAGALGLRIAAESGAEPHVVLNDKNPRAAALIRANVERNGIRTAEVLLGDLNAHLADDSPYDLVEIDPFGSPVPFLDSALRSSRRGSALGVTATDTAVLCGAKPEAARRRYLADVRHTDAYAEVGTRVLLGYLARAAGRFDRAIEPVFAYAAEHFVHAHVRLSEGAARADRSLAQLGAVRFDPATGGHDRVSEGPVKGDIGPLWLGPLADPAILASLRPSPATGFAASRILERMREEATLPAFYYENNETARRAGVDPPSLPAVLDALRARGARAAPTLFRANAFKTDAPASEVLATVRELRA